MPRWGEFLPSIQPNCLQVTKTSFPNGYYSNQIPKSFFFFLYIDTASWSLPRRGLIALLFAFDRDLILGCLSMVWIEYLLRWLKNRYAQCVHVSTLLVACCITVLSIWSGIVQYKNIVKICVTVVNVHCIEIIINTTSKCIGDYYIAICYVHIIWWIN